MSRGKEPPLQQIHDALKLDGDPDHIRDYYAQWAGSYDSDLVDNYIGPQQMADLVDHWRGSLPEARQDQPMIMDAGCGTGLAGQILARRGYRNLVGSDLSPAMIEQAAKTGAYTELAENVDLSIAPPERWIDRFDVILCCGVFTLGHVEPDVLEQLITMTRTGGLIITSTRTSYYDATSYQELSDQMVMYGAVELLEVKKDAPYTLDGNAHYWIYRKLP